MTSSLFDRMGGRPALLQLLRHFYADVRQQRDIAPIFAAQIQDWPAHLETIADFWTKACGGLSTYRGSVPERHIPLGLKEEHFRAWLGLWDVNCRIWLAPDCAAELSSLARQIGARLRQFCGISTASSSPASAFGHFGETENFLNRDLRPLTTPKRP